MIILFFGDSVGSFFRLGLSMRFAELEFSVKSLRSSAVFGGRLKRPSPCGIRSAPRPERGRIPSETSEKLQNIACRGEILEILDVSWRLQRLDDLQHWHHFQTVVANVLNFAVAYSRAFILLDVCRAWAFVCFAWRLQGLNEWNT